ncbi:hypothetical protein C8J57DRAFT_1247012 [Mycena rebaudengoi]|nr:hypothetical protein C8J57DRAFT_1247012 [Mycena rebaudengoi]
MNSFLNFVTATAGIASLVLATSGAAIPAIDSAPSDGVRAVDQENGGSLWKVREVDHEDGGAPWEVREVDHEDGGAPWKTSEYMNMIKRDIHQRSACDPFHEVESASVQLEKAWDTFAMGLWWPSTGTRTGRYGNSL